MIDTTKPAVTITPEIAELIELHKLCENDRDRVEVENQIWAKTSPQDRAIYKSRRRVLLGKLLGGMESQYVFRCRENLHDAPSGLWEKARANHWVIGTISNFNSKIRTLSKALDLSMEEAASKFFETEELNFQTRRPSPTQSQPRESRPSGVVFKPSRTQWHELRTMMESIVDSQAAGLPELERRELMTLLNNDIQQAIAGFGQRLSLYRSRIDGEKDSTVTRRQVVDACEFLHVNAPEVDEPANLKQAKTQMRRLVRLEHPDTGSGNTENYNAIMAAYVTLEAYNQQIEGRAL